VTPVAGTASNVPVPQERETAPVAPVALPPLESLTPESDFTAFMQPQVDEGVKRLALKKLFSDPRFNVMDGLDVYIDDYSKESPLPEGWLEKMEQVRHLGAVKKERPADAESELATRQEALPEAASLPALKSEEEQEVVAPPLDTSGDQKVD
jgi:Protein of unknown function (DUF3306)